MAAIAAEADAATAAGAAEPVRLSDPRWRSLTIGLVMSVTIVAFTTLSVTTILPVVADDLGGLRLYGWVFSAFFVGVLVGTVLAGQLADSRGLVLPFVLGLVLFMVGLAIGGLAPNMGVLVAGRAIQGLGGGAVPAVAYAGIARNYPVSVRPRMFAVLSTAWVVPGLVGPALAGLVADHLGWRWVFIGLLPPAAIATVLTVPALRPLSSPAAEPIGGGRLLDALQVAAGTAAVLAGVGSGSFWAVPLVAVGMVVGLPALRRLLPPGTLRAAEGLPAAVLARGVLAWAYFGANAYVALSITQVRGYSATAAGITLAGATLTWTAGSWCQARLASTWESQRLAGWGFTILAVGLAGTTASVAIDSAPLAVTVVSWTTAGLGMGLCFATTSVSVLRAAPAGREGFTSSALGLLDNLGRALGAGLGGAAVALGVVAGWDPATGITVALTMALLMALGGLGLSRRMPRVVSG